MTELYLNESYNRSGGGGGGVQPFYLIQAAEKGKIGMR